MFRNLLPHLFVCVLIATNSMHCTGNTCTSRKDHVDSVVKTMIETDYTKGVPQIFVIYDYLCWEIVAEYCRKRNIKYRAYNTDETDDPEYALWISTDTFNVEQRYADFTFLAHRTSHMPIFILVNSRLYLSGPHSAEFTDRVILINPKLYWIKVKPN